MPIPIQKYKYKILKLDYSQPKEIKKKLDESYKLQFNWKYYLHFYTDLKFTITKLDDAWNHFIKYGITEKRKFFLNELNVSKEKKDSTPLENKKNKNINTNTNKKKSLEDIPVINQITKENKTINNSKIINNSNLSLLKTNNLIYKYIYDNYGIHYSGWKEAINSFIKNLDREIILKQPVFFDDWIEKFLIWGDKIEKQNYLRVISDNNYKIITFCHNPPFKQWYNSNYKNYIKDKIIYNNEHSNHKLIKTINEHQLEDKIIYFYTLTNYHKEYIYSKCPKYHNKLVSIYHPIDITGDEKGFDFSLFCQNKQIIHVGWWLRNFKTFINFNVSKDFNKSILIKSDFENEWNNLSCSYNYNLDDITIIKELNNTEYEFLFNNSCIFIHFEDACANNTILECIKFNTPIIVNKIPGIVEYLGENYPLYFKNNEDLLLFNNPNYLLKCIQEAHNYLAAMNKSHVLLKTFNTKLNYDLNKLKINDNNTLTWFCYINNIDSIEKKLFYLYNNFVSQNENNKINLHVVICESLINQEGYSNLLNRIKNYSRIINNIAFSIQNFNNKYSDFLNYCVDICESNYLVIIDIQDKYDVNYSSYFIQYLNETPNCDIAFSSYTITNNNGYSEDFIFCKDMLLFESSFRKTILNYTGVVWRKDVSKINEKFISFDNKEIIFRDFWCRALKNNLNIKCCNDKIMYTSIVQ